MELLGHMVVLFLIFVRKLHTACHSGCSSLHSHQQCRRVPFTPQLGQHIIFCLFDNSHSGRCQVTLIEVLTCISLLISDVKHLFMCLLAICVPSLEKCLFRSSAHFSIRLLFDIELYEFFICFLYIFYINHLLDIWFVSTLSLSGGCLFIFLKVFVVLQKFLVWCNLIYFCFCCHCFGMQSKNISLRVMSRSLSTMFSSRSFMVSDLTFKSLKHFELVFVNGVR